MKLYKSSKEPEIYHYFDSKGNKLWMYRHRYYNSLGKRKEKSKSSFKTEKAALKALLEVKALTLRGQTKLLDYEQMTIGQWFDIWYESNKKKWKESTRIQREHIIRLQIKPLLGHYKLQKLDKLTYERIFIQRLQEELQTSSVKLRHNIFKIAMNAAVEEEILSRNRFTKVVIKSDDQEEKKVRFLSPEQLNTFLEDVKQNENITNYTFMLLVAYTGFRRGEALGLYWSDIDFTNHTINIERTRDDNGIRTPKTKNSYRTIIVDELVINQLKDYKKWCTQKLLAVGKKISKDTLIFISETADKLHSSIVTVAYRRIIKRTDLPRTTIHSLRHTHATILLNKGFNVKLIADRLGNTPKMIHDIYGHVLKELEHESVLMFSHALKAVGGNSGGRK